MTIKNYLIALLFITFSLETFAAPATAQQVEQLVKIEHWDELKPALVNQGLPNFKAFIEQSMIQLLKIPQPISAHHQVFIMQITDLVVNDAIEQIDEKNLIKNMSKAYQNLSTEQAAALLQLYQQPMMQNAAKKSPVAMAYNIDNGIQDFLELIDSDQIKTAIQALKQQ